VVSAGQSLVVLDTQLDVAAVVEALAVGRDEDVGRLLKSIDVFRLRLLALRLARELAERVEAETFAEGLRRDALMNYLMRIEEQ
jgi:hypothetical protein